MHNHNTIRIPDWSEVKRVLSWGTTYALLHIPYIPIKLAKETFRLSYIAMEAIDRLYTQSVVIPMRGLVYVNNNTHTLEGEVVEVGTDKLDLFDWSRLVTEYDNFPHVRIIGKSGSGKTYTAEQVLKLLGGEQWIITCKKKPHNWVGLKVYGVPFNWDSVREGIDCTLKRMWENYNRIERNLLPIRTNVVIDEWRSIKNNVSESSEQIKELISVARDSEVRLVCLATGEQVKTWGLEGESDLGDCFTTVRLKSFAIDHAKKLKLSSAKLQWLYAQDRPCMVDDDIADLKQLQEVCNRTNANSLQPKLQSGEPIETTMPTVLQPIHGNQNEVHSEYKNVLYRLWKNETMSESDLVKKVMNYSGTRYGEGKALLNSIIQEYENE